MERSFIVQNLKCGGCAKTISKALGKITGIDSVKVDSEHSTVVVNGSENLKSETVEQHLASIGYPIISAKNSAFQKINSYVSCMSGKLN